jgi:UDP-N-acetylmuramoyl-L-alanyl-D-glutamate--2,6-diaminopimelate ligase
LPVFFYGDPSKDLSITAITGTNGKTTIAYLLAQAYEHLGSNAAYIGTLGYGQVNNLEPSLNTTPDGLCLQQLFDKFKKSGLQQVCMEVSSHALSLNRVDHVSFKQALYTNLSHEHLDFHHTIKAYANEKAKLFAMPGLESAVINLDDDYAKLMISKLAPTVKKYTYGLGSACDVQAVDCKITMTGSEFNIVSPWGNHQLRTSLLGTFNIYNNLAVFTSLLASGMAINDVVKTIPTLCAAPGRMEVVAIEPCVIVDYAHSPDALENVLFTLNQLKRRRIITVFGCGGERDKKKRPLMGRIASENSDLTIITSDNPRREDPDKIIADIADGMDNSTTYLKITAREDAILKAINLAEPEDIILIAGKGHESYQQIGDVRINFSDKDIVAKMLAQNIAK